MVGIVFNKEEEPLELGWESFALRTGLCFFEEAACLGPSVYMIMYEDASNKLNFDTRLRALLQWTTDETELKQLQEMLALLKLLRKNKHPQKREIVFLKQTEKIINDLYMLQVNEVLEAFQKIGLSQLAPFHSKDNTGLILWYVNHEAGEEDKNGRLSRVLTFEMEDDDDGELGVFILYERLAHEVLKSHELTPLATLPNLSMLETDKLRNVRTLLEPQRKELAALLPMIPPDGHGNRYYAGRWDTEGVKAFAPRLQETLNAVHELDWAAKAHFDFRAELHVGNMDTLELWQLLRDNGFIPDDTWEVLQQKRESGIHCPTTAIITITSEWGQNMVNDLTAEETLMHKRKTINLN